MGDYGFYGDEEEERNGDLSGGSAEPGAVGGGGGNAASANGEAQKAPAEIPYEREEASKGQNGSDDGGSDNGGMPPTGNGMGTRTNGISVIRSPYAVTNDETRRKNLAEVEEHQRERQMRNDAIRAASLAARQTRQDLLDSGRYFDDGRGNVKLKRQFRRERRGKTWETLPDDGSGNMAIRKAADNARDAYRTEYESKLGGVIAENRREMAQRKISEAADGVRRADGNLAIYRGLVAAMDDLRNGDRTEDEFVRWGDKDVKQIEVTLPNGAKARKEVPARFDYDEQGRIKGAAAEGKRSGLKVRSGFVSRGVIGTINSGLKESGDGRRITGIVARQRFNPDFPDKAEGVNFYVQGVTLDPKTGKSERFGRWMDAKGVYQMALRSGKDAGYESLYSEDNLIDTWGDLFGTRARKEREARMKDESAARQRLEELEGKRTLQRDRIDADERMKRMQIESDERKFDRGQWLDAARLYMKDRGGSATDKALLDAIPKEAWQTILAGAPLYEGEDGTMSEDPSHGRQAYDEAGNPMRKQLTHSEALGRIGETLDFMKRKVGGGRGEGLSPEAIRENVERLFGRRGTAQTSAPAANGAEGDGSAQGLPEIVRTLAGDVDAAEPPQDGPYSDAVRETARNVVLPEMGQRTQDAAEPPQDESTHEGRLSRIDAIRAEMERRIRTRFREARRNADDAR